MSIHKCHFSDRNDESFHDFMLRTLSEDEVALTEADAEVVRCATEVARFQERIRRQRKALGCLGVSESEIEKAVQATLARQKAR